MSEFKIGEHLIGPGQPALIIAEVAQAHDGSVNVAHAFIDAIAEAGANAVKFQTHIAEAESSPLEQWRVPFSKQDKSRFDYWKRMEFSAEQWRALKEHAEARGLIFLSSPFSLVAVELLESLGMAAWKIASGEVRNELLLEKILATQKPVLLSSGMSSWDELAASVKRVEASGAPLLLMQCTSAYPCPAERVGLNVMTEMQARFGVPVGLSDHSGTIWPSLAAVGLGASAIELHVIWDKSMFGPDTVASVTFRELKQMVEGIRFMEKMRAHPVDKNVEAEKMAGMRGMFGQGLVAARDLDAGTILKEGDLSSKKPLAGIPASEFKKVVGQRLTRGVRAGEFLQVADIQA